ncbi:MAG: hypothetical protein IKH30_17245 [Clostridia bacterium]|nr:hypothetical protein [Clostridia bacterium]
MLQWIFGGMIGLSLIWSMVNGGGGEAASAILKAAEEAVQTAIALCGAYAFFCGMLNIARRTGAPERLGAALSPLLKLLFGSGLSEEALEPVTMNLTANLFGLGTRRRRWALRRHSGWEKGQRRPAMRCACSW